MGNTVTTEKINVRSPFFITANNEGAPPLPATSSDPVSNPTVPVEYVEPTTFTETVQCGQNVKIGEDVGSRIYKLNVGSATGIVTIDYTVNVPVSITGYFNTTVPSTIATDFVGSDAYQQQLLDAGIASGGMSLTSGGVATGSVTVNKTTASPETVEILVFAPLKTFDYQLTFNCPTPPSISAPTGDLPAIPSHSNFVENIPAFFVQIPFQARGNAADLQLFVGNQLVQNITTSGWYVFTDFPTAQSNFNVHPAIKTRESSGTLNFSTGANGCIASYTTPTTYISQSTYFTQGVNNIAFKYTPKITDFFKPPDYHYKRFATIQYVKTGLFYDHRNSVFRYPIFSRSDMVTGGWAPREGAGASGQGDNLVEIFQAISPSRPFAQNNFYSSGPFGDYGEPKKHSIEFHWQSTTPMGLNNPTRGGNAYLNSFAGRTYRELLDDGMATAESLVLNRSRIKADNGLTGCFS